MFVFKVAHLCGRNMIVFTQLLFEKNINGSSILSDDREQEWYKTSIYSNMWLTVWGNEGCPGFTSNNVHYKGCPNLAFFNNVQNPFLLNIWQIFFDRLGGTLHCSKIGQYKA